MTLRDLWLIIRHYLKWVIVVPVVCALLAGGFMYASDHMKEQNYTATSTLTVTDPTAMLSATSLSNLMDALAQNEVAAIGDGTTTATAKSDATTQSITFSVTGSSESDAVEAANGIALQTAESIKQALSDQSDAYLEVAEEAAQVDSDVAPSSGITAADRVAALRSCVFTVAEAKTAVASGSSSVMKYAAVGLVGGLFLVICALALLDSVRRPIKSRADIAEVTDLPVLAEGDDVQTRDRLWINACFAFEGQPSSVCLLPVSGDNCNNLVSVLQEAACDAAVVSCRSLQDDLVGARVAREAEVAVVVVRPWFDKTSSLIDVLSELQLAKANVIGVVLL